MQKTALPLIMTDKARKQIPARHWAGSLRTASVQIGCLALSCQPQAHYSPSLGATSALPAGCLVTMDTVSLPLPLALALWR